MGCTPCVEGEIDERRKDHPSERGHGRQCRSARVFQFARHQLTLDLDPDHKKEDCHQAVVDPHLQWEIQRENPTDPKVDLGLE